MNVIAHDHGVSIDLTPAEFAHLAEFLGKFSEGGESIVDRLSAALDAIIESKA